MKQRDRVAMSAQEIAALLAGSRKVQLATISRDGTPHLVAMYYVMIDGQITFWTYRSSQKARNLARDPRVSCLVETGEQYFDLRGVQIQGTARCIEDPAAVRDIGRQIAGSMAGPGTEALEEYLQHAARKRVGYAVQPSRVISWDHSKLLPADS
jgi:PPOX class probable F420-dependent enzyme